MFGEQRGKARVEGGGVWGQAGAASLGTGENVGEWAVHLRAIASY